MTSPPVVFLEKKRSGRTWSAEQRKTQSLIAKKYWADKRAKKEAK